MFTSNRFEVGRQTDRLRTAVLPAVALVLLGCAVAGCDLLASGSRSDSPRTVASDGTFEIEVGAAVRLGRGGPLLSFEEVSEDSRCPENVMCVWAGRASVVFHLVGGESDTAFVLTMPGLTPAPHDENDDVPVHGFVFKLLELSPYPVFTYPLSNRERRSPPYRALLRVETASNQAK